MTQICSSDISMEFCRLFLVNGLERSSWCCFLISRSAKTDLEIFLHNTHMRPNLMLAGCPMMIGLGVLVSTM